VSIDVNSAGSEQKVSSSVVNLKINLEAAREIAFQLRLRNLGGIIVIDFINMNSNADKEKLRTRFIHWLEDDPAKTTVYDVSALGLLEMSRQRSTKSLFETFQERCDVCDGFGIKAISRSNRL
jgi:ribonuclease G